MRATLVLHVLAGCLGLIGGYLALYSAKGAPLHRKAGMLFVCAMLATAFFGVLMAVVNGVAPAINVPAGSLLVYLVVTSLATVRPPGAAAGWLAPAGMALALAIVLGTLVVGARALGSGQSAGIFSFVMFGVPALLGAIGDRRLMRSGPPRGAARLARHLWRMCFALFLGAISFFVGQAKVFPEAIRIPGLLAVPVVAVLLTMFYWLWRVRARGSPLAVALRVPEPVALSGAV
jgi:hypothetical protein